MGSPSPRQFLGTFGKVTSPFRRLLGGASDAGAGRSGDEGGDEAEVSLRKKPPEWLSIDGEVMHGRWKGYNAAIWYPLKEKEILATIDSIEEFRVVCRDEKAMYEFLVPELERFVSASNLEYAHLWRQRGVKLRVHISAYHIVEAALVTPTP